MIKRIVFITLLAISISCNTKEKALGYIEEGNIKYLVGDYKGAIKDYNISIEIDPNNALAFNNKSAALRKIHYDSGYIEFKKAIELDSTLSKYYSEKEMQYAVFKASIEEYNLAIQRNPKSSNAYKERAIYKGQLGDTIGNKNDWQKANVLELSEIDNKINLTPNNAKLYFSRANVLVELEKFESALYSINKGYNLDSTNWQGILEFRANLKDRIGDKQGAEKDKKIRLEYLVKAISDSINKNKSNADFYLFRGESLYELGKLNDAISDLEKAIELNPKDYNGLYLKSKANFDLKNYTIALEDLNKGFLVLNVNNKPLAYKYNVLKVKVLFALRNFQEIISFCNQKILLIEAGITENAERVKRGESPLKYINRFISAYYYRAIANIAIKNYQAAIEDLNTMLEREYWPNGKSEIFRERGKAKGFINDIKGAMEDFTKAIELNPKDPLIFNSRGDLKFKNGDTNGACSDWSKSGELGYSSVYEKIKINCKIEK